MTDADIVREILSERGHGAWQRRTPADHDRAEAAFARMEADLAEVKQLREALEHYADENHWNDVTPGPETNTAGYLMWEYDGGNEFPWSVARAALEKK